MAIARKSGYRAKIARSKSLIRSEGVRGFVAGLSRYLVHQYTYPAVRSYRVVRGSRSIAVGGVSATFGVVSRAAAKEIGFAERNERELLEDLLSELSADDVFFDVGGNIGIHACLANLATQGGSVVAFEPHPTNARELRRNAARNGCSLRVVERALSDGVGTVRLAYGRGDVSGNAAIGDGSEAGTVSVRSDAGDAAVERGEVPHPTVVKIDVEGAEPLVIEGMKRTLADERCRTVYCEIHRPGDGHPSVADHGESDEGVRRRLRDLGFDLAVLNERGRTVQVKGTK